MNRMTRRSYSAPRPRVGGTLHQGMQGPDVGSPGDPLHAPMRRQVDVPVPTHVQGEPPQRPVDQGIVPPPPRMRGPIHEPPVAWRPGVVLP